MTTRDSSGNPFIDFVWGNMPMEPNDDRAVSPVTSYFGGGEGDANYGSATLVTSGKLDVADYIREVNNVGLEYRTPADSHIIAASNYVGFPEFSQAYPYNDTITNVTVPNVVNILGTTAQATLTSAGLTFTSSSTTVGATSSNANKVKTQAPAAGSLVNAGEKITLVTYNYVAPATTGPISAIRYDAGNTPGDYNMFLIGQTVKPTVGDSVTTTGNGNTFYNTITWEVMSVVNDDAYNTGGTKVVLRNVAVVTTNEGIGGTWTKV
jgi:hypothetical protein